MRFRWFFLLNLALLLLYGWTLTEQTAISVQVADGRCTALLPERQLTVACPELDGGSRGGLYLHNRTLTGEEKVALAPLDWLAPAPAWTHVALSDAAGRTFWQRRLGDSPLTDWRVLRGDWRVIGDELRADGERAVLLLPRPLADGVIFTADLRRANRAAALLLLAPDADVGYGFVVTGSTRRGVWWRWENGRFITPIQGVPFQKPLLPQTQVLLRTLLRGHQGFLLLFLAAGLLSFLANRVPIPTPLRRLRRHLDRLRRPSPTCVVAALTLAAFGLALFASLRVLDGIPHVQDSITYRFQAQTLAAGQLWAPAPPLPPFFEQEFLLVENGRWFGKYTPGWPLLLTVGVRAGAPWLINPLLAALTIPLLYLLGAQLFGRRTGVLAAALAVTSPFFIFMGGSMMAHVAELFWLLLFMVAALRARRGSWRWAAVAGAAAGMAFLTRQLTAVGVIVPFMAVVVGRQWPLRRAQLGRWLLLAAAAVPFVLLLFGYQWALTGDPLRDPRLLFWPYDRVGFGTDVGEPANALQIVSIDAEPGYAIVWFTDPTQPPRGHTLPRGLFNTVQNWRALELHLFGWPLLLTTAFLWAALLGKRPSWSVVALLAAAGGLVGAYVFYWADGIMYGPRYYFGALPVFLLLTAVGVPALARRFRPPGGTVATALLLAALVADFWLAGRPQWVEEYQGFNFVDGERVAQVETAVAPDEQALVFVETTPGSWAEYGALFVGNSPWLNGRVIYARDLGTAQNLALQARYPRRAAYRLTLDGVLVPVGVGREP